MNEDFLQFLWQYRLFNEEELFTDDQKKIEIVHVGTKNSDAGPDFFNARIKYNNIEWAGNIEIHRNASDWYLHNHQHDETYNNVILHVVWNNDTSVYNSKKQPVLTVTLPVYKETLDKYYELYENHKPIACSYKLNTINFPLETYLESLAISRLEKKTQWIYNELKNANYSWEDTFYRILAYSFGLKANSQAFLMLAQNTPLTIIKKNTDHLTQIEALIFGQAGLLPKDSNELYVKNLIKEYEYLKTKYNLSPLHASIWKFSKIHPPSFPTIRLAQWSYFLYKQANNLTNLLQEMPIKQLIKHFNIKTSAFWESHYHFDRKSEKPVRNRMGKGFLYLLFINSFLPFIFLYSREKLNNSLQDWVIQTYEQIPSENNSIIKYWQNAGIVSNNALQSQALIYLYDFFCKPRFCLRCNIGTCLLLNTKTL